VAATAGYRGSLALRDAVIGPPFEATALALTCWDDSFALHGIQVLPTPLPPGPLGIRDVEITTDVGSHHRGPGLGGHGHPRLLWHATFEPALPPAVATLTFTGTAVADGAANTSPIRLPHWPPTRHAAPAQETTRHTRASPPVDRAGAALPDRVVALSADLGIIARIRRALTVMYCWPAWFLVTIEAPDLPMPVMPRPRHDQAWEIEDDRGNRYLGMNTGGWNGPDNGAHIAFTPGLDPRARQLRLAFPDPFGQAGSLTAAVAVPSHAA
jgi:hypothetical protein